METEPSSVEGVEGRTPSRQEAVGRRWHWGISATGIPLILWETQWSTGERDLVLGDQDLAHPAPVIVTKLMSRRRALIERRAEFDYMSARRVDPDLDGWPKFSACSALDIACLVPDEADKRLRALGYMGCASRFDTLGATGPNRQQLVAMFVPDARAAAVGFYALTRVVPTLTKAGMVGG